jgi:hypothetical protein
VKEKSLFQSVASHSAEKRWREVILLTIGMVPKADEFICQFKQSADTLLANDQELQEFLDWSRIKTQSVKSPYKPSALRAYYFWLSLDLLPPLCIHLSHALALALVLARNLDIELSRAHDLARANVLDFDFGFDLTCDLVLARALTRDRARIRIRFKAINRAQELVISEDFQQRLQNLLIELPNPEQVNEERTRNWWSMSGQAWTEKLRLLMMQHRNIGHDWQFTSEQLQKLGEYLIVNQLLADCLNSDCVITRSVREEIEDTLLLPIAEIEKNQEQIELLQLDQGEIRVAEYLTGLPSQSILQAKLHEAISAVRERVARQDTDLAGDKAPLS